jgi:ElaB/YqjD/DUF883 family membrane-anchored ribosome-binding protein
MNGKSNTIENALHNVGTDIRGRITSIASRVRDEAQDAKEAVCDTLEEQREYAAEALSRASRKATRLTRRHPLQVIAGALVLGFLIGRIRR